MIDCKYCCHNFVNFILVKKIECWDFTRNFIIWPELYVCTENAQSTSIDACVCKLLPMQAHFGLNCTGKNYKPHNYIGDVTHIIINAIKTKPLYRRIMVFPLKQYKLRDNALKLSFNKCYIAIITVIQ